MGFSITPTGILTALAVVAVPLMGVANWKTLVGLFRRLPLPESSDSELPSGPPSDSSGPHVLDVMKTLTEVNQRLQLGCEDELCAIYAKIVASTSQKVTPAERP